MTIQAQTITTSQKKQLSDGNPDGTVLGQGTTDLISFYGVTPVAQQTATAGSPVTTLATSTTPYGFATSTQANQVISAMAALQTLGLIA